MIELKFAKLFKDRLYLLIPLACFLFWSLLSLINNNFKPDAYDFNSFYQAGRHIFTEPGLLYTEEYYYLPSFAEFFSILSLFPYEVSVALFYAILIIFGELSIILFDQILILKNVNRKLYRVLILLVISNGYKFVKNFDAMQTKLIVLFLFLAFIKHEIKFRQDNKYGSGFNLKFKFIQIFILILAIGMIPTLGFVLFIYLLYDLKSIKDIISRNQMKIYLTAILIFLAQNFMFLVSPSLISNFISGFGKSNILIANLPFNFTHEYILAKEGKNLMSFDFFSVIYYIFINQAINFSLAAIIIMGIFSIFLMFIKSLSIEDKMGYYVLFSFYFNIFMTRLIFIAILPLIVLLFVKNLKLQERISISFIKANILNIIGLLTISFIYFLPTIYFLTSRFHFLTNIPIELFLLIYPVCYVIITISLGTQSLKNRKRKTIN